MHTSPIRNTDEIRNHVINFTLFTFSIIGLLAVCTRLYFFIFVFQKGWDDHMSFFFGVYLCFPVITLIREKLSYMIKSILLLVLFYALALYCLIVWGFASSGMLWLCLFSIFVMVFFDIRKGLYATAVSFITIAVVGYLICNQIIQHDPGFIFFSATNPSNWIATNIFVVMIVLCIIYTYYQFNSSLNDTIVTLTNRTNELEQEITIRRKTETALRESESKYRVLFESAGDSILLLKEDIIIDCNRKTCEMLGRKREQIIQQTPFDFSPETQPDGSDSRLKGMSILDSLTDHDSRMFEWTQEKSDGTLLHIEPNLAHMKLNNETYTLAILRNVTDRKHAEEKLLREKQFSETVINSLPGIFFMYDEGKNLIRWNTNHELITGYSAVELRKMKIYDWGDENDQAYIDHKFQEGLVEGEFRLEFNIVKKGGEKVPFYLSGSTMHINDRTYLVGIGYDLTERKTAEKALAVSEKRFRELVETITVGICIVKDGVVVYMNPKQLEILGKYPESFEIKGLPFHQEDVNPFFKSYEALVSGETRMFEHEMRLMQFRKKTGRKSTRIVFCNGSKITYMGEIAVLMTMVDITKTRELEELVHLREKMVSLGHVAAGIAHEIRNPLSGINILVDGIREDIGDPENTDNIKKDIVEIQKASNKISMVIKRVLDFSRPGLPSLVMTDINIFVSEAVELSKVTLRKSGVVVTECLAANLPKIQVDGQAMEQVLLNLITNAANAMKNIEGEKKIEVASWLEDDEVFLSVADSGNGISEELKEKIFDPFFTTRSDGSGIGLSLCQRIITDHGGTIHVFDSDLGGAEFKIKLPVGKG